MNTPTPTPRTDAAWSATFDGEQISAGRTARALRECSQQLETELAALTAERDQLRAALALGQQNCDDAYDDLRDERNQFRAEVERLETCGITELAAINPSVADYCKHWEARAERAESEGDVETLARVHNGGPRGHLKPATKGYGDSAGQSTFQMNFASDVNTFIHGESINESLRILGYTSEPSGMYRKRIFRDEKEVAEGTAHDISRWIKVTHPDYFDVSKHSP